MEIYLNVEESEASVLTSEMKLIPSGFEIGQDRCNMVIYTVGKDRKIWLTDLY
jgi:hypothetical protein